tara:strand:- start:657 stop:908 length:252 start_codon:yes stop_codon:yes gene_type:complete
MEQELSKAEEASRLAEKAKSVARSKSAIENETPWSIRPTNSVKKLAEHLSEKYDISRNDVVKLWLTETEELVLKNGLNLKPKK